MWENTLENNFFSPDSAVSFLSSSETDKNDVHLTSFLFDQNLRWSHVQMGVSLKGSYESKKRARLASAISRGCVYAGIFCNL